MASRPLCAALHLHKLFFIPYPPRPSLATKFISYSAYLRSSISAVLCHAASSAPMRSEHINYAAAAALPSSGRRGREGKDSPLTDGPVARVDSKERGSLHLSFLLSLLRRSFKKKIVKKKTKKKNAPRHPWRSGTHGASNRL